MTPSLVSVVVRLSMVVLTLALVAAPAGSQPGRRALSIAVSRTPLSTPFYVAEAQGYFAAEGIDVRLDDCIGGNLCVRELLERRATLATASEAPVMFHSFERDDYTVVATFVTSTNDVKLVVRRDTGIRQVADLRGKRVGAVEGSASQYFLDTVLILHRIDPGQIRQVDTRPDQMAKALKDGMVDALAIWDPYAFSAVQALAGGAFVLPRLSHYRLTFNLIAMREHVATEGDTVAAVLRALERSIELLRQRETIAQEILIRRLGLEPAFIAWTWPDLRFGLALDQQLLITLESQARWALRRGLVRATGIPNYLRFLETDTLSRVKPAAVTFVR